MGFSYNMEKDQIFLDEFKKLSEKHKRTFSAVLSVEDMVTDQIVIDGKRVVAGLMVTKTSEEIKQDKKTKE